MTMEGSARYSFDNRAPAHSLLAKQGSRKPRRFKKESLFSFFQSIGQSHYVIFLIKLRPIFLCVAPGEDQQSQ